MVPPDAPSAIDHVTRASVLPVTLAVNCCLPPVCNCAVLGETATVTFTPARRTVTVALALRLGSEWLAAVTWKMPSPAGAVKRPVASTLPPSADQTTAVSELPMTVALNFTVAPGSMAAEGGLIETSMRGAFATETAATAVLV